MKQLSYLTAGLCLFLLACSPAVDESHKEEIMELDSITHEMEETQEAIEDETEDMVHDVDSLLEGI